MKISVTIPCYKSESTMLQCIKGIRAQTVPVHEVIVIDDASPDNAGRVALGEGCKVTRMDANIGLAASMNVALEKCEGDFLAKIDSDVELLSTWLEVCLKCFTGDGVAGVGGRMVEFYQGTVADRWRAEFMQQHWGLRKVANPVGLFGCDQLWRVKALKDVGGWNPKYRTNHEDMDLSMRMRQKGWHLVYTPLAIGLHLRQDDVASVLKNFWMWYHTPAMEEGFYVSVQKVAELIGRNRKMAVERFNKCVEAGRFDLCYPCLLLFYWLCLRDLEQVLKVSPGPITDADVLLAQSVVLANLALVSEKHLGQSACSVQMAGMLGRDFDTRFLVSTDLTGGWLCSGAYGKAFTETKFAEELTAHHWRMIEISARMCDDQG